MKRSFWKVIIILAVAGVSIASLYPFQKKINLGLDLKGGMHLVLRVDTSKIPEEARKGALDRA
ncbi:MAG: protein translocase subunit SecD, partial [Candidatus Omnitrophica bacterium]|nr:protein translocase subunit SecD [Candidatus Omnitrophota bacterium]